MPIRRREFLAALAAGVAGCATSSSRSRSTSSSPAARVGPAPKPKRILVLGGTGYVGPHIVRAARAQGHTVTLFNRGKTAPGMFPDVETIIGDRVTGDLDRLRGHEWDAVIDTWVMMPKSVHATADILKDHVGQYLFLSTISVYKLGKEPIDESSPVLSPKTVNAKKLEGVEDYGGNKALAEHEAEELMPGRATAIRAGVIVGPGDPSDRFIYWPLRFARGGEVLVPGTPADRMQLIDVRDLSAFIIRCIDDKIVGVYNTVGPDDPSLPKILDACRTAAASDATITYVDNPFLEAEKAGGWDDFPLTVDNNGDQPNFSHVSAQKAIARGLSFRAPVESARDALAWYNAQPDERRNQKRPGIAPEREAALLQKWHAAKG